MKHTIIKSLFLFFNLIAILPCFAQKSISLAKEVKADKIVDLYFSKGNRPPFSFVYNNKNSEKFIKDWNYSKQKVESSDQNVLLYKICYTEPGNKIQIECDVKAFKDYEAIEWTLHFTNLSKENSANIKDINTSDIFFDSKSKDKFSIFTANGSNASRHDFEPIDINVEKDSLYNFSPANGRSSDTSGFPFFNIMSSSGYGVMASIGWSGTWVADFKETQNGKLHFLSGMKYVDLFLYPGESIRTPLVSLLFWKGEDRMDGQNIFRQFILAHHTRKINGSNPPAPFCAGFEWGDPAPCNEYSCLTEDMAIAIAKRYKQFDIMPDVFWLDAGWHTGAGGPDFTGKNWYNTVGDWSIDKNRFPNGFKKLSDEIHKMGAKFMVWFEPERVMRGSFLAETYPKWMLKVPENDDVFIFNLGDKDACDFMCKYIGDLIEENGIDYYRQDFNIAPAHFWEVNDEKGRKGISEIRHIEGLYKYWDYLLTRFPNMQIDNCASGGRRIDIETTSRATPLWRTDYSYGEPNGYQNHTYNLSMFLPLHGTGIYNTDNYNSRSSFCSAMVINWEINSLRGNISDMQKTIEKYKGLKEYYLEDFYPLSGDGDLTGDNCVVAYQLNKPSDNSGVVIVFRRGNEAPSHSSLILKGLDASKNYIITNDNNANSFNKSGAELMKDFSFDIEEAPGSILFYYKAEN
ncbi:MAG: alpha-galactosidase [Bacteroidales bacterium]|nr:alpha-galactosidase [Bacteroidales bacterium]